MMAILRSCAVNVSIRESRAGSEAPVQRRIIPKHSLDTAKEESHCPVHYQIRQYARFKPISEQKPKSFSYTTLAITSIEADEQTRANRGNIFIGYPIKHTPPPDRKVLLKIDGDPMSAVNVSGSHPLPNIRRGTQQLALVMKNNKEGKIIHSSDPISFTLHSLLRSIAKDAPRLHHFLTRKAP